MTDNKENENVRNIKRTDGTVGESETDGNGVGTYRSDDTENVAEKSQGAIETKSEETECDRLPSDSGNGDSSEDNGTEMYEEYERRAESDLAEIKRMYPQFAYISHLSQIENAPRFAQLREMGLSIREAFLATNSGNVGGGDGGYDNRSHLYSAVPRSGRDSLPHMTRSEMEAAKEIFGNLSEREIQLLWKRANG